MDDRNEVAFVGGFGNPSGSYFPFHADLIVFQVNRQNRHEVMHLAYRKSFLDCDVMDNLVKLLRRIDHESIESVNLAWASRADLE